MLRFRIETEVSPTHVVEVEFPTEIELHSVLFIRGQGCSTGYQLLYTRLPANIIKIHNYFNETKTSKTTCELYIINVKAPPSTKPYTNFKVRTYQLVNESLWLVDLLAKTQPYSALKGSLNSAKILSITPNEIREIGSYKIAMCPRNKLLSSATIRLTFPSEIGLPNGVQTCQSVGTPYKVPELN